MLYLGPFEVVQVLLIGDSLNPVSRNGFTLPPNFQLERRQAASTILLCLTSLTSLSRPGQLERLQRTNNTRDRIVRFYYGCTRDYASTTTMK